MDATGPAASLTPGELRRLYELMVVGRTVETRLLHLYRSGRLPGTVYPGVGQEGAMVGFGAALEDGDVYGGTHRDLVLHLARGVTLDEVLLNVFGKAAGPSGGRDGGVHFGIPARGTLMASGSLPAVYPVAVGWALAFRQDGSRRVALADCGEGATATGTWHESVTLAARLGLPVVFTIQNNGYAYATPSPARPPDRGAAYGVPHVVVDGNDVLACFGAARRAVDRARAGGGPTIVEALTFRRYGHAGHDAAEYVDPARRAEFAERDPIARFETFLVERGVIDDEAVLRVAEEVTARVEAALRRAAAAADPDPATVGQGVFAGREERPSPPAEGGDPVPMTMVEALRSALGEEMARDERVMILGEDVGAFGGAFKVTEGLQDRFGADRVVDTPIAEAAIVGAAIGAAVAGRRPVVELQFMDFVYPALDQLVNQGAKHHWKTGRSVPLVVRGPVGAGVRAGPSHSLSPEGLLAHHPGLKVVCPATPADAKGLLLAAIRDPDPVVFLEHKKLYRSVRGPVPGGDFEVPLGKATIVRPGGDVTIVTWGAMRHVVEAAAEELDSAGISVEIVDLRSLVPFDRETVFASVAKTSRLLVVQEDQRFASVASEVAAVTAEELLWDLDAPIRRVTPPATHVPFAAVLEDAYLPQVADVVGAVRETMLA